MRERTVAGHVQCVCRNGGVVYHGGVVVTREIISVWWCRIQGAVPVEISGVEKMIGFR
ncbi:hypothetical protein Hanom_Chr15g01365791 [Helianthus anomalus]